MNFLRTEGVIPVLLGAFLLILTLAILLAAVTGSILTIGGDSLSVLNASPALIHGAVNPPLS